MAGHSKFKNIMHRKGAQDAKRAKIFTKLIRELTVAAKEGGSDLNSNSRLRSAVMAAKQANMPKDRIESAIKSNKDDGANYEYIIYYGYGPCQIPTTVECLTDNKNRTITDVKNVFNKSGGSFGANLQFMFNKVGAIIYEMDHIKTHNLNENDVMEIIIESGANNFTQNDDYYEIFTELNDFHKVQDNLIKKLGEPQFSSIAYICNQASNLSEEDEEKVINFIEKMQDADDVQKVWTSTSLINHV